jgi:hypothetical protein
MCNPYRVGNSSVFVPRVARQNRATLGFGVKPLRGNVTSVFEVVIRVTDGFLCHG